LERTEVLAKIEEILSSILDDERLKLAEDSTADDFEEWDSLNHVKLMVAIEAEYSIRFETNEITAPDNVGELVDLIMSKF